MLLTLVESCVNKITYNKKKIHNNKIGFKHILKTIEVEFEPSRKM